MSAYRKHACHECGRHIEYPEEMFGQAVNCPACARETTLGEVYPDAPSAVSYLPPGEISPPAPVVVEFFVTREGKEFGPYSLEDVQGYLETGFLKSIDLGWCDGMQDWKPINTIEGVIKAKNTGRPPPPRPVTPQSELPLGQISSQGYGFAYSIVVLVLSVVDVAVGSAGNNKGVPWQVYWLGYGLIHFVEKKSMKDPSLLPSGWWTAFVPMYLYRRAKALRQPLTSLWVFFLLLGLPFAGVFLSALGEELQSESRTSKGQTESANAAPPMPTPPATPPPIDAVDNLLVSEGKQADELIEQIKSTQNAVSASWNKGIRGAIGGPAQLAMIRDQIVPVVRETKNRIEQFRPKSAKLQPVRAAMLELVQFDFTSWIGVNNAGAADNWIVARGLFDRMEIDRAVHARKLQSAIDSAVGN